MIYYLFLLILLFSILLMCFFVKSQKLLEIKYLIFLIGIGAIYELVFSFYLKFSSEIWFKIYSYLEFITLLIFFRKLIGMRQSVFLYITLFYTIIFAIFATLFFEKINVNLFELFIPISNCLLVFNFSTKWTLLQFEKLEASSLFQSPIFYILSGMILYYTGTFFIFGLESMFRNTKSSVLLYFWYVNLLLIFIYRLSFYIAIWKAKKL
jgi:hypothetical protein